MEIVKFNFEELKVYQKSLDFVDLVYGTCKQFPKSEQYILSSQFLRAATSISLNISEGSTDTKLQFNRFLKIARGSIDECVVCSTIALRQNYISEDQNLELRKKLSELSKRISGLQKFLMKKI